MRILINNKILDKFVFNIGIYSIQYNFSDIIFVSGLRRHHAEMLTELSIYKENKAYCDQSFGFSKLQIDYLYRFYHTVTFDLDLYTKEKINMNLSEYIFNLVAESCFYKYENKFKNRR
jgi:hypothetical protein